MYKDDQLLYSAEDGEFAAGPIGLHSVHIRGIFDDVLVTPLPGS